LGSGTKLVASRRFKEARPELQTSVVFDRKVIGKEFKKDSQAVISHLENLKLISSLLLMQMEQI
jgi:hypothetical protein